MALPLSEGSLKDLDLDGAVEMEMEMEVEWCGWRAWWWWWLLLSSAVLLCVLESRVDLKF